MAKTKKATSAAGSLGDIAEALGSMLGNAERQWRAWQGPRDAVVKAVTDVRDRAAALLSEIGAAADARVTGSKKGKKKDKKGKKARKNKAEQKKADKKARKDKKDKKAKAEKVKKAGKATKAEKKAAKASKARRATGPGETAPPTTEAAPARTSAEALVADVPGPGAGDATEP